MATRKVTYTLDETTVGQIERAAGALGLAKSQVVREAVAEYAARLDRLSEEERGRMLRLLDEHLDTPAEADAAAVDRELAELRRDRRAAGRKRE